MNTPLPTNIGQPATNALKAINITSLEDLSKMTEKELSDLHGIGPKAVGVLKQCLDENKMSLLAPQGIKPKSAEIIEFNNPLTFRSWLTDNVQKQDGIWLRIYKKASGVTSVTYAEALDEALCFGWIDGQRKGYDELSFIQKFTPRRKQSLWSKRNIEHIERLRAAGKMTAAGEAEIKRAVEDGRWDAAYDAQSTMVVPDYFLEQLEVNDIAKTAFNGLNKSAQYSILLKLQTAKTDEIRLRRMEKIIAQLLRVT